MVFNRRFVLSGRVVVSRQLMVSGKEKLNTLYISWCITLKIMFS
jgi:hypothetical protein